ncbi:hypothetical protein OESDEN_16380 [Oesophagostomum dentatum]|uniref:Uncharacterized protein n=1 Tax=Oesophagostomum dentatum TaxID=61180 RepID=A0A0B1SF12_OESDE|nr:hypothetical protein OESDEN_16380 [Oesophagostomum dentatum]
MSSDTLAAALSLQVDEYPVDLSATDDLVEDIVAQLDKHSSWKLIPHADRLITFQTILRLISSRLMTNAHSIYFVDSLERNSELVYFSFSSSEVGRVSQAPTPMPSAVGLFPAACWFNHSCRANLNSLYVLPFRVHECHGISQIIGSFSSFYENKLIFVSMGIRQGEEICDNYGASFFKNTKQERADFLAGRGFTCNCTVCLSNDSIDHMLEPIIEHPDVGQLHYSLSSLILKSLPNVDDYRQYRSALPDGHKIIEIIAEMYTGSRGGQVDPEERLFLYGEMLECQRKRGLHFSPDQIRILLNCVVACYDAACKSSRKTRKFMDEMQVHLFAALIRMRTFYGKLYPAYDAAKVSFLAI